MSKNPKSQGFGFLFQITCLSSFRFSRDHLFQRHIQRLRQRPFAFACLDLREIGLADSRRVGELLLGQSARQFHLCCIIQA